MSKPSSKFEPRICLVCGKEFTPYNATQKTCSEECSKKLANMRKTETRKKLKRGKKKPISNMKAIEEIVKDGPEYGLKVAEMEGRLIDKNTKRVRERTKEILQEVMEELRL